MNSPEVLAAAEKVLEEWRNMPPEDFAKMLDEHEPGAIAYAFTGMMEPENYMHELEMIKEFYGDQCAHRSKVPLINHITEGLTILDAIGASDDAKKAYCIHPMTQGDKELEQNFIWVCKTCSPYVIALAMEYRSVANEFLSEKIGLVIGPDQICLSPLKEVNDMLIADKVQNRKDFITYHRGTHPRSEALDMYFQLWLKRLGITEDVYLGLCTEVDNAKTSNRSE